MTRRGRPLGEISRAVLTALAEQPRSSSQLARDLQANQKLIVSTVCELKLTGRLTVLRTERSPRSGRRVAVLALTEGAQPDRSTWPAWMR